jgi:hypothetical protein
MPRTAQAALNDGLNSTAISSCPVESNAAPVEFCPPYAPCFGQVSTITIGQTFSPGDPLEFSFVLDKSEIPKHTKIKQIPMYHDGVAVPNCTAPGVASPTRVP